MGSIGHSLSQYEYSIIICDCGVLLMSAENSNYLVGYDVQKRFINLKICYWYSGILCENNIFSFQWPKYYGDDSTKIQTPQPPSL